jgi:hypothetical protein
MVTTTKSIKAVRITVDLDEDLHRQLKIYCAKNAVDIASLIRAMLAARFRQVNKKTKQKRKLGGPAGFSGQPLISIKRKDKL